MANGLDTIEIFHNGGTIEIKGYKHTFMGIEFFFQRDKAALFDIYHVKSGAGFNYDGYLKKIPKKNFDKVLEKIRNRFEPVTEFERILNEHPSLEETLAKKKKFTLQNYQKLLAKYNLQGVKHCKWTLVLEGIFKMDMFDLDRCLKYRFRYTEQEHGSINDFLLKEFGEDGCNEIKSWLFN